MPFVPSALGPHSTISGPDIRAWPSFAISSSFVRRISRVDISRTIVQSVVSIGRGLGMDIVAEGVETEFEAMMMTKLGCTELQGYYFSRPISADQMTQLLRTFQPKRPASAP